jgi:predicted transglutaminase-like cysteine proteinase
MLGSSSLILLVALNFLLPHDAVLARVRTPHEPGASTLIIESSPTLAPFQYIRFCMNYPDECLSNANESERIDLTSARLGLLERVNHRVNSSIVSRTKIYGSNLEDKWTISPRQGDCNDYAVTKRHELLMNGLPASALRLSVTKTADGVGHLVLVVATTNGDLVMDSLVDAIQPWQTTDYQWLKIQSSRNPRYWVYIKSPPTSPPIFR